MVTFIQRYACCIIEMQLDSEKVRCTQIGKDRMMSLGMSEGAVSLSWMVWGPDGTS